MTERLRWAAAFAGLVLWAPYPFFYVFGTHEIFVHRCAGRPFTGIDDCHPDGFPIEFLAFPLTVLFAYPFACFAFSIFGPSFDDRLLKWRLAAHDGGQSVFPAFQIGAAVGIVWALMHLVSLPLHAEYSILGAYWAIWISWFILGALASLPSWHKRSTNGQ